MAGRPSKKTMKQDTAPILGRMSVLGLHKYITEMTNPLFSSFDPSYIPYETRKKMSKDPVIALALNFEMAVISGQKWWIRCENETIAQELTEIWTPIHPFVVRRGLSSIQFGWAPFEKEFKIGNIHIKIPRKGKKPLNKVLKDHVTIKQFLDLHTESWEPYYDKEGSLAGLKANYNIGTQNNIMPARKAFIVTNQMEFGNLKGKTRFEQVYRAWFSHRAVQMFCDRYYERKADPPIRATAPTERSVNTAGQTVDSMQYMQGQLGGLKHGGEMILPFVIDEATKKLKFWAEPMNFPERGDLFLSYLNYLDALKIRGMLQPEKALLQSMAGQGTYAETSTQTENSMFIFNFLLLAL